MTTEATKLEAPQAVAVQRLVQRIFNKDKRWYVIAAFAAKDIGEIIIRVIFIACALVRIPMHFIICVLEETQLTLFAAATELERLRDIIRRDREDWAERNDASENL